jgi:hypothetical protein
MSLLLRSRVCVRLKLELPTIQVRRFGMDRNMAVNVIFGQLDASFTKCAL